MKQVSAEKNIQIYEKDTKNDSITWNMLKMNPGKQQVWSFGRPVPLTQQEYRLLELLVQNPDTILSRNRLLEEAWGYSYVGETRTVDNYVMRLRRKLGLEEIIQTVYKQGYLLSLEKRNSNGEPA